MVGCLDRNDKFERGDNSFNHMNPDLVFWRGFTKADLILFGKVPVLRDTFTMRVSIGTILLIEWGKRLEGIGSDWQVDFGGDNISCLISSKDTGLNDENIVGDLSGIENGFILINGRFKRRVLILSLKKELYWSAKCITGGICWDRFDRCKTLSMECLRDLESKQLANKDEK